MPFPLIDVAALLAAVTLAALGGELFLKGLVALAICWRLPQLLVATSLSAFATSSPELTVSTISALAGRPEIGLGDSLGSNVVNIALVLGIALLFGPLAAHLRDLRRDALFVLAVPVLLFILLADDTISRLEGVILLLLFCLWLTLIARQALAQRREHTPAPQRTSLAPLQAWPLTLTGLACLIVAGQLFVIGATGIATALHIQAYVIGATVVAIGTSLPELVTTLLSRWHGHDDVGLGTLLGSNLFNGLAIVGLSAAIHPIQVARQDVSVALVFGIASVLLMLPQGHTIPRRRGFVLLTCYAAYVVMTFRP
ncbi:MAG: sodium:calcium antiporter [Nitrospira sp.]|nr:sodium:calcium antiporter [Nitrospira sp.]